MFEIQVQSASRLGHILCRPDPSLNDLLELLPDLKGTNVAHALMEGFGDTALFATELTQEDLSMHETNHIVARAVEHENSLPTNRVTEFLQLRRTLMVESSSRKLTKEALPRHHARCGTLAHFAGGEAVAVCREALDHCFGFVRFGEPFGGVAVGLYFGDLVVEGFGDHEVDSVAQVLEVGERADDTGSCGDEVEAADSIGDEHALVELSADVE